MQNTNTEDVIEIDLQELFVLLLHRLWLIVLCGVVAGMVGFFVSRFVITPQYKSTTKVYILNKQDNNTLTYSDMQLGTQLTKDYAQLIKGRDVLEPVIVACGLNESYGSFVDHVQVETLTDTRIIAITVEDPNPAMAQLIATEIRKVASEHIKNVMDIQAVNVAEEAFLPERPSSPSVLKWTGIGLFLGAFLCAMVIVIRFLVDDTIKTSEDVEKYLNLSTLAMIPLNETEEKHKHKKRARSGSHRVGDPKLQDDTLEVEELEDETEPGTVSTEKEER